MKRKHPRKGEKKKQGPRTKVQAKSSGAQISEKFPSLLLLLWVSFSKLPQMFQIL
jgi:hypothetical protein